MSKLLICEFCSKTFINTKHSKQRYCSTDCGIKGRVNEKYNFYLENQNLFCNAEKSLKFIKRHILVEQNYLCEICESKNSWNDKELIFILDHVDGNAANNLRNNLRLICPNCDSQLDTYKSKNKKSARVKRYKLKMVS